MRKPRLNENTIAKLEIYGQAKSGKNYYELIDYIDADGHCYTKLEWTDLKTGDIQAFDWIDVKKEG